MFIRFPVCILRAMPTCTLWKYDYVNSYWIFRPYPKLKVSDMLYVSRVQL